MENRERSGRPEVMSDSQVRNLVVRCKQSPFRPATHLRQDILAATGSAPSMSTIRNRLFDNDLLAYRPRAVPMLKPHQIAGRKKFGQDFLSWEKSLMVR